MKTMIAHDIPLPDNWQFAVLGAGAPADWAVDDLMAAADNWLPAQVPGTVYQDLLRHRLIADPNFGRNEQDVQWVAERDWLYRLDFEPHLPPEADHLDLVFEGLDTYATVWLNGERLFSSDNMFIPVRHAVKALLRPGVNRLVIRFDSALRRGRDIERRHEKLPQWNGDSSRLYVRKAPYHYGWDWGPVLLTAGPWKPVRLQAYSLRIDDLHPQIEVDLAGRQAWITLTTQLAGQAVPAGTRIRHHLFDAQGAIVSASDNEAAASQRDALRVRNVQLWWPAGMGGQPLYRLETELLAPDGQTLDRCTRRLGLRQLALLQQHIKGEPGTSFHFAVNGREFFTGGANWIPEDNLLNRVSPERYRQRVQQALDAHMVMLRVWGGGIYEDEAFYDACDELGMLVWQDFLFACGVYPAHAEFQASVKQEAECAVRRLRHRASLALWCGNNEDYAIAESVGRHGPGKSLADFPARQIYEQLLPAVCAELDPGRPYWPGSPYSPSQDGLLNSADRQVGDRHSWEIWHGAMLPYQDYKKVEGRFVSEFGMQSHPSLALLESVLPPDEQHPHSKTLAWHNKAGLGAPDGHRRLAVYMADNLRVQPSLADHVYATQFVQAEAMRYAYQDYRRRWQQADARAVGGALVWQLNDCWPVTSWALIDSAGVVKPAWHVIRRALAPVALAVRQRPGRAEGWVMNAAPEGLPARLHLTVHTLTGQLLHEAQADLEVRANGSTEFGFELPTFGQPVVLGASLHQAQNERARDVAWPEPFRFHDLPKPVLTTQRAEGVLTLRSSNPVKGLWLEAPGVQFSDNFIDLLPQQTVHVHVQGQPTTPIRATALQVGTWTL